MYYLTLEVAFYGMGSKLFIYMYFLLFYSDVLFFPLFSLNSFMYSKEFNSVIQVINSSLFSHLSIQFNLLIISVIGKML